LRAEVVDYGLGIVLTGNERRPARKLLRTVQVTAGNRQQAFFGNPTEQLPTVEELHPVEEPVQLSPVAREVACLRKDCGGMAQVVGVRHDYGGAEVTRLLHGGSRPVVHAHESSRRDRDRVALVAVWIALHAYELIWWRDVRAETRAQPLSASAS
jgi:hypothetical protein